MSPASVALLLLLAITAEARTRDQTRSIRQDSTGPDVLSLPWAHGVLKNELNVKHLDESGISLPFAGHGSTMLEPHTVLDLCSIEHVCMQVWQQCQTLRYLLEGLLVC